LPCAVGGEQHTGGGHGSCHLEAPPVPDERFALGERRWSAAKSFRLIAQTRLPRVFGALGGVMNPAAAQLSPR